MSAFSLVETPLGLLQLVADEKKGLVNVFFEEEITERNGESRNISCLYEAKKWLSVYFSGEEPSFFPKFSIVGTEFQKEVWRHVAVIPYGTCCTYGDIARTMERERGRRVSAQAVGQAVGKNPLPLFIPCHRVLGQKGKLTGYHGGVERKIKLLELEHIAYKKSLTK